MTSGGKTSIPMDQPQGLCDLIGLSFRIWRDNLPLIIRVLIVPTVVYFTAATALQWCLTFGIHAKADLPRIFITIGVGAIALIVYFVALVFLSVRQMALLRYFTGFASDYKKALAFANKRFWWLVLLSLITVLCSSVVLGIFVCIVVISGAMMASAGAGGAIFGAFGMLLGFVALMIAISLIVILSLMGFSILSCDENCTFFEVIGQSFHWTFKYFGRILCFGFIFYVVFSVITVPVSLPVVIASLGDMAMTQIQTGKPLSSDYHVSIGVLLFIEAWEGLCSLLLRPITMLCFGLLYLDLRQRADGIDLSRKLKTLKAAYGGAENGIQGP